MKKNKVILSFIIVVVFVCIAILFISSQKNIKPEEVVKDTVKEKTLFQTSLNDLGINTAGALFIVLSTKNDDSKNVYVKLEKNGEIKKLFNQELNDTIMDNYKGNYNDFKINIVDLKTDKDIGIEHYQIEQKYYDNTSGYVVDESLATSRKNICVSTSEVYYNWTCFIYDDKSESLILTYAQNFFD